MKSSKILFLVLLMGCFTTYCAEEKEREEAAALDPEAESKALQELIVLSQLKSGHRSKAGKLQGMTALPKAILEKMRQHTSIQWPPFEGESLVMGAEYGEAYRVVISDDQRYMAVAFINENTEHLLVYDMRDRSEKLKISKARGSYASFYVEFFKSGNYSLMFVLLGDDDFRFYDLKNMKKGPISKGKVFDYTISPNKRYIAYKSSEDKNFGLYTVPDLQEKLVLPSGATAVKFSSNGHYLATENKGQHVIELYDIRNFDKAPKVVQGDEIRFLADDRSMAIKSLETDQIKIYSIPDFIEQPNVVSDENIIFSPDRHYRAMVEAMDDEYKSQRITFYATKTPNKPLKVISIRPYLDSWFFVPDKRHLLVDYWNGEMQLYDMQHFDVAPKVLHDTIGFKRSPNNSLIAFYRGDRRYKALYIYKTNTFDEPYAVIYVDNDRYRIEAFSDDNKYLVLSSDAAGVIIWDLGKAHNRLLKTKQFKPKNRESTSDWFKRFNEYSLENVFPQR